MSGGGRGRRAHEEEEHENHERWLVTYADMLTVLMALFIVMFAMSVVDKTKFEKLKQGLDEYFGHGPELIDGGSGLLSQQQGADQVELDVQAAVAALEQVRARDAAVDRERLDLERARQQILAALTEKGLQDAVRFRIDERGLVVTIVTDDVLFELGKADLREGGRRVLDAVTPALIDLPNPVTVEGHTDDLPIRSVEFPSNWELSTERSTQVLRYLVTHGLPAARLSAAGYADQRPVAPNVAGQRAANRRVEVVVRATAAGQAPEPAPPPPGTARPVTPDQPAQAAARPDEED